MAFFVPIAAWMSANAGTVALAASAAVTAAGAISSSKAQAASYKSSEAAAKYNAAASMQNANSANQAASANELAMRRQNDQRMGAMRAQAAESGGFTGSNIEVLDQSATNMELDALNTRYRGQMQGAGLLSQANLDSYQAQVDAENAGRATTAGYIGAASSALGAASNYYNYRGLNYAIWMPSLVYNQQTDVGQAQTPADARGANFTPAIGQATEQLGQVGARLSADYQHLQYQQMEADGVAQLQKNISDGYRNFSTSMDDWKADPNVVQQNGAGLTGKFVGTYNDWQDQLVEQQKTPRLKRMAAEQARTMGDHFFNQAHTWEVETNRAWRVNSVDESINTDASTLDQHPELYDSLVSDKQEAIDAMKGLHPADHIALSNKMQSTYAEAAALGATRLNPQRTVNILAGAKPLPQGSIQQKIVGAAAAAGVDPNVALAIVNRESKFDPNAYNPSGASGLFQFMTKGASSTWNQYAPPGANPFDPDTNIAGGVKFTADNIAGLKKTLGRDPTPGEILAAHNFGLGGARALLKAPDALPFSSLVAQYDPQNASATVQQNALGGKTVGDVKAQLNQEMTSNMAQTAQYANTPPAGQPEDIEAMPSYFQKLSPQGRQAVLSHAETILHKDNSEAKMTLQARIRDKMTAWQNGEEGGGPDPTYGDYASLYPASEATRMYNDQLGWKQFGADVGAGKGLSYVEQQTLLQARQATLVPGTDGYADGVQRLNQLSTAFGHIDAQRGHDQMKAAKDLGGMNIQELDVSSPQALVGKLQVLSIQADQVAQKYNLPYKPFTNEKAIELAQIVNKAPAAVARQYLAVMAQQFDSPEHYKAGLQQIAPNNPTFAVAGLLAQSWAPGQIDAASVILEGDRRLNPSKGDKAEEGKHTKIPFPEIGGQKGLRQDWEQQVGQAYGSNQQTSEQDFNAALAYYAGRIAPGAQSEQIDQKVWKEAIDTVAPHTNYAGRDVLIPQGSSPDRFSDGVAKVWPAVMAANGLDPKDYPVGGYPLVALPDGSYAVADGSSTLYGKDGNPVRFNLTSGPVQPTSGETPLPEPLMPKKPSFPKLEQKNYRLK